MGERRCAKDEKPSPLFNVPSALCPAILAPREQSLREGLGRCKAKSGEVSYVIGSVMFKQAHWAAQADTY